MSTIRRVAKNSIASFVGDNISKFLTLVLVIFIARFFGDVDYGKFAFAISFAGLFIILIDLGTRLVVTRDISTNKEKASNYLYNLFLLKVVSSFFTFILIFLIINLLNYPKDTTYAIYIASLIIIFDSLNQSIYSFFQAFQRMEYPAGLKVIRTIIRFSITLPLLFLGYGLLPVLFVYLLTQVIGFILALITFRVKISQFSFKFDYSLIKYFLRKGFPFLLASAFVLIYFRIDITMLSIMKGDAVVGWYQSAYNLIDGLITIPIAFSGALFPVAAIYYKTNKNKLIQLYNNATKFISLLSFPLAFGVSLLADNIILLIYGEEYANAIPALQILIWVLIPLYIVFIMGMIQVVIHKEKLGAYALGFTALVNVVLNLILIPKYSLLGAAIATIISEGVYLILYYIINAKFFYSLNLLKITWKPFIASVVMGIFIYYFRFLNLFVVVIISFFIYLFLLYILKAFGEEEKTMLKRLFERNTL